MLKDAVNEYIKKQPARFHMPGHKGKLCAHDITELDFSDDLHSPCGGIKEIQDKCASIYGARAAFLLINGSSAGICAFCIALALKLQRKPRIMVARDCHKSFISGAFLSDALVCGVFPEDELFGTVTADAIEVELSKLSEKPDAIYITSPNYYGMCADTKKIYDIAHRHGILLFADAAHGAHFPFSNQLPEVPFADVFTVSTHKTLEAYNQTGILLCNCDMQNELAMALSMMQTTSPSYPLMMSIAGAMDSGARYDKHMLRIKAVRDALESAGISLAKKPTSAYAQDNARLCIKADGLAKNGYELEKAFKTYNIYPEMSDLYSAVLITTPFDDDEWYERLRKALKEIKGLCHDTAPEYISTAFSKPQGYISIRKAMLEADNADKSVARCSVGIYPPGIAITFPGEKITAEIDDMLTECKKCGAKIFGRE